MTAGPGAARTSRSRAASTRASPRIALRSRRGSSSGPVSSSGEPFRSVGAEARWHTGRIEHGGWRARLGATTATADAPLALWSGAGTGQGREPLLRAHPLLDHGVVTGRTFGRTLAYTGIERQAWAWSSHGMRVGWSLFVDGARAWDTLDAASAPLQVDAGAGLRIAAPGTGGEFRIAAAHGLADGRSAVSVGWGAD